MKRTKEEAQQTKEAILETAFKEFLKNGYEETTIDGIAKASGNTRGAVYWHFKDKDDIYEQLVELKDIESISLHSAIVNSGMSPLEKIEENLKLNFPEFKSRAKEKNFIRLKCELYFYRVKNGDKRNVSQQVFNSGVQLIKEAIKKGEIRKGTDPLTAAKTLISLVQGSYTSHSILFGNSTIKEIKKPVFEYLESIKSKK